MSEPQTELIDTVTVQPEKQPKPAREMSQAAIASFFYGTLQLLSTMIGSALVVVIAQSMKAFQSAMTTDPTGVIGGTDTPDLAEMQKMIEELGITDPSIPAPPATGATPDATTVPAMPSIPGFSMEATPNAIVTHEVLIILLTHGFGIFGLFTAFIAFGAASKGKSGRGLAVTGLISSFLSFVIAFMVALAT